jgi:integrase
MTDSKKYGTGSVFLPKGRNIWRISYWYEGRAYTESSGSADRRDAVRLLRTRLKEMGRGRPLRAAERRATFENLVELLKADYRRKENRSLDRAMRCVASLRETFECTPASSIDYAQVEAYINARLDAGAAVATVKQERAILGRMLTLAVAAGLLPYRPKMPMMGDPDNVRVGFFEEHEFRAVQAQLPEPLKAMMEFCFLTGWRPTEVRTLAWRQVDFEGGAVRLDPGKTKNREGRVFPFGALPEMAELLHRQRDATTAMERERASVIPWVFHRNGKPILTYHDAWRSACERAGLVGKFVHDFRRTAVRRLERAGVPRSQAMRLVGHKTESVYRRYAIVAEADLNEAVAKVSARLSADRYARGIVPIASVVSKTSTEPLPRAASDDSRAESDARK